MWGKCQCLTVSGFPPKEMQSFVSADVQVEMGEKHFGLTASSTQTPQHLPQQSSQGQDMA